MEDKDIQQLLQLMEYMKENQLLKCNLNIVVNILKIIKIYPLKNKNYINLNVEQVQNNNKEILQFLLVYNKIAYV